MRPSKTKQARTRDRNQGYILRQRGRSRPPIQRKRRACHTTTHGSRKDNDNYYSHQSPNKISNSKKAWGWRTTNTRSWMELIRPCSKKSQLLLHPSKKPLFRGNLRPCTPNTKNCNNFASSKNRKIPSRLQKHKRTLFPKTEQVSDRNSFAISSSSCAKD